MVEGNGIDLGSVYGLLREVAAVVNQHHRRFDELDRRFDGLDRRIHGLDRRFGSLEVRLEAVEARVARVEASMVTKTDIEQLRQEVRDYHAAVVGHGMHISEHDERLTRIEDRLGLPHA